ncbi:MAG: hypothetical protein PF441_07110 [Desulfuromusa sp.]|jgi:hypothetical protein|nr:hypothetical protein [Desulfuromusa sp.]
MKLWWFAPQKPGTAPMRGQSRICCHLPLNSRHSIYDPENLTIGKMGEWLKTAGTYEETIYAGSTKELKDE